MCRTQGWSRGDRLPLSCRVCGELRQGFDAHVQPANYATQLNDGVHPFMLFFGSPVRLHPINVLISARVVAISVCHVLNATSAASAFCLAAARAPLAVPRATRASNISCWSSAHLVWAATVLCPCCSATEHQLCGCPCFSVASAVARFTSAVCTSAPASRMSLAKRSLSIGLLLRIVDVILGP